MVVTIIQIAKHARFKIAFYLPVKQSAVKRTNHRKTTSRKTEQNSTPKVRNITEKNARRI